MKKILCIALCVMMVLSLLAGCGETPSQPTESTPTPTTKHVHAWETTWTNNETSHWKACSGCGMQANLGAHIDDNQDGVCNDCGYVEPCEHTFNEEKWLSDAENHWHPATCKHEGMVGAKAAHVDENNDGICDVCEYSDPDHSHSYKDEWTTNEEEHWHDADCGHDLVSEQAPHVDVENDGVCDVCQWFDSTHTHTYEETWSVDAGHHWNASTCGHTGAVKDLERHADEDVNGYCDTCNYLMCTHADFDVDGICDICGYEDPDHTHTYHEEWASNHNGHWNVAVCHPGATTKSEAHVDKNNDGNCDVCAFVICSHTYKKTWSSNDTHHWYQLTCTCSIETRKNYGEHVDADGINGCDICLHGYQAPSPVQVILNKEKVTIVPNAMITWQEVTITIPKAGRYLITSDNTGIRWYTAQNQDPAPTSYASEIYFTEAGEVTLLARYFDFSWSSKGSFDIYITLTSIEDLVLNTSRGKAELPTMMNYKVVFEAMEVGTWTLTTSLDAVCMGLTEADLEFTHTVEVVVEEPGDLVELWVFREDEYNSTFIFDWELQEPFQLDVGVGHSPISVPAVGDDYKVVFTAPEDGQFLLTVTSDYLTFSEWGLGGHNAPVRTESMQQLTPVMKAGETFTTWIQPVYNYPMSTNINDTLTIINVGTMLNLGNNELANTGNIYSFIATESNYYKISVIDAEIGITTNGVTQWIAPKEVDGVKVASYEVKVDEGDTYVFQIRTQNETIVADLSIVEYKFSLEHMWDSAATDLALMGQSYTVTLYPSKMYDLTIPENMLKLRVKLDWNYKGVTVYVDGEEYQKGTELYLQDVKQICAKMQNNEPMDVTFSMTVTYAPTKTEAVTDGNLTVNKDALFLVEKEGQARATFTAEVGGSYTLRSYTKGARIYVENELGERGELVLSDDGSYNFEVEADETVVFIILGENGEELTVQLILTQGSGK